MNGLASVGDRAGGYEIQNVAPISTDPEREPLKLEITEFTDDYVAGRLTGEVRESLPARRSRFRTSPR